MRVAGGVAIGLIENVSNSPATSITVSASFWTVGAGTVTGFASVIRITEVAGALSGRYLGRTFGKILGLKGRYPKMCRKTCIMCYNIKQHIIFIILILKLTICQIWVICYLYPFWSSSRYILPYPRLSEIWNGDINSRVGSIIIKLKITAC